MKIVLAFVIKIRQPVCMNNSTINEQRKKDCRGCRFTNLICSNKYRASWKDKYLCNNCKYYTAITETNGLCELNDDAYREWCYSGCSRYKD